MKILWDLDYQKSLLRKNLKEKNGNNYKLITNQSG
jgi:hypothetical protein